MMKMMMFLILLIFPSIFMMNSLLNLFMFNSLIILMFFIMFMFNYNNLWMSIYSIMGLDFYSFSMLLLSIWIISLMYLVSNNIKNSNYFSLLLLMLLMVLILSFMMMNYFMFYLFFEISLIPTFLLIMGWGYQPERMNAGMYMMLYTMFASLPLLIIVFYLYNYFYSLNYFFMKNMMFNEEMGYMFIFMILAFLIKLPMFMFHMWLPKAHVEAPVSGSMILAGVMLKLGGYGIFRSMNMMFNLMVKYNIFIIIISLIGMIILSGVCLRQYDMKLLVAYSSVVHMGMMLMSLMMLNYWGVLGSLMMMIGHGFCSPLMFVMVNYFYERSNSRSMLINKGLIYFFPSMMLWWFMICIANMSAPISLNLLSELVMIPVILNFSMKIMIMLMIGMFISASYSLYLFSYSMHGKFNSYLNKMFPMKIWEYFIVMMHWIPLNFFILKLDIFI
uniref:NADH-ubiquinone oxidoreductase chain 4 n=1 Tax=Necremnus tutae TaxID=1615824 RepID=A0A7U3NJB8_9HYME|nr:NADH dehydrogenase subunit 4 [Necremnus tutae]QOV03004.1 NADH dehydrogenase subunit 4 [Necremnus tutae]